MYTISLGAQQPTATALTQPGEKGAGWAAAFGVLMLAGMGAAALGLYMHERKTAHAKAEQRLAWEHETASRWAT